MDEGMFALSIINRNFDNLISERLVWEQSAPITYMYIVKFFGFLGSYSPFSLRLLSLLSYVSLLAIVYYILKNIIPTKFPLIGCALIASFPIMIRYSNEFKVYTFDTVIVLLIFVFRYLIDKKQLNYLWLSLCFIIGIWSSNPSCFIIGAILLLDTVLSLYKKDYVLFLKIICVGIITLIGFIIYYFLWLKPVIDAGFMKKFWSYATFDFLFFTSKQKFELLLYGQLKPTLSVIGPIANLFTLFVLVGTVIFIFKRANRYVAFLLLTIALTFIASSLGYYPITSRLIIFLYPIAVILFAFYFSSFFQKKQNKFNFASCIIIISLLICQLPLEFITRENAIYREGEEINDTYAEVKNIITDEDELYVAYLNTPVFLYLNKYDSTNISKFEDNVILGTGDYSKFDFERLSDFDILKNKKSLYIIPLMKDGGLSPLMKELDQYGELKMVFDKHKTYLYHYSHATSDSIN